MRDYIYVSDLAAAHLLALSTMDGGVHRVYNLGNGNGFSNRQVIDVVRKVTGHPVPTEVAPRREGDPAALVASSDKPGGSWAGSRPSRRWPRWSRTPGPSCAADRGTSRAVDTVPPASTHVR